MTKKGEVCRQRKTSFTQHLKIGQSVVAQIVSILIFTDRMIVESFGAITIRSTATGFVQFVTDSSNFAKVFMIVDSPWHCVNSL